MPGEAAANLQIFNASMSLMQVSIKSHFGSKFQLSILLPSAAD